MADSEDDCPLAWWRTNRRFSPALATVVRQVLCIPVISASVERFFSRAGLTINQLRNAPEQQDRGAAALPRAQLDDSLQTVNLKGKALKDVQEEAKQAAAVGETLRACLAAGGGSQ